MIDSVHLKRLLLVTAALLLVSAGAVAALGAPAIAGGLVLGWVLGAAPFISWSWIVTRALLTRRGRLLAVLLLALKLAVYSGALYLCVTRAIVSPVGVFAGMTGVALILILGCVWHAPPAPAKETP